jgi:hypothetical protein
MYIGEEKEHTRLSSPKPWVFLYRRLKARPALLKLGETRNGCMVNVSITNP